MVTPSFPPNIGGLESHVSSLAAALSKSGTNVDVLTQAGARREREDGWGTVVRTFPSIINGKTYRVSPQLAYWLGRNKERYDVVHVHSYHGAAATLAALAAGTVPVVLTPHYHGRGHTLFARMLHVGYRPLGSWLVRRSDAVICVSRAEATLLSGAEPSVSSRLVVIPNAPAGSLPLPASELRQPPQVLSCGRLVPYKNNRLLLEAFQLLGGDATLVIAGSGVEYAALSAAAAGSERVSVVGEVERAELDRLLSQSSVVACLSGREAFGMSLLEGLVSGARALVSDIPAHREVVELCQAGDRVKFIKLPASAQVVASAMAGLLAEGHPSAPVRCWDWGQVAGQTMAVYRRALVRCSEAGGTRGAVPVGAEAGL